MATRGTLAQRKAAARSAAGSPGDVIRSKIGAPDARQARPVGKPSTPPGSMTPARKRGPKPSTSRDLAVRKPTDAAKPRPSSPPAKPRPSSPPAKVAANRAAAKAAASSPPRAATPGKSMVPYKAPAAPSTAAKAAGKTATTGSKLKTAAKAAGKTALRGLSRAAIPITAATTAAAVIPHLPKNEKRSQTALRGERAGKGKSTGRTAPTPTPPAASRSAPKADDKPVKTVKTKGGDYPVYKKNSAKAASFRDAFAAARKAGKKEFEWNGRKYNTKVK